jgi:CheY-like chemotaxis protein/tetratricopeptide (TPR) repeat protein
LSVDRKHILLVDSDEKSRRFLELSLKKDGYGVTKVSGVIDALTSLHQDGADGIVCEIDLADGDGPSLIEAVDALGSELSIPVLVITASKDAAAKARCIELGADVLSKPAKVKRVLDRVSAMLQHAEVARLSASAPVVEGDLSDSNIVDLVNEFREEGKSGAIRVERGDLRGTIYFSDGEIIDAESVRDQGVAAVKRIFTWDDGAYTVVTTDSSDHPKRISKDSDLLLDEAMGYAAEWADAIEVVGSMSAVYTVEYRSFVAQLGKLPEETNALIRTFDGVRTVEEAIARSEIDDLRAVQLIAPLVEAEVLQLVTTGSGLRTSDDSFERLKTNAFKPITRTAEQDALAKRRSADAADKQAREDEARRLEEERLLQVEELQLLEAEAAELENAQAAEIESANAEAEALRAEAAARAAALREEAAQRAAGLAQRQQELRERRFALTGQLEAIQGPPREVPEPVAALRDQELAALEEDRGSTISFGTTGVTAALGGAGAAATGAAFATATGDDAVPLAETAATAVASHHTPDEGATLAMSASSADATLAGAAAAPIAKKLDPVAPTTAPAAGLDDEFFSGASVADYTEEEDMFADASGGNGNTLLAIGGLLIALLLILFFAFQDTPDAPEEPTAATTEELGDAAEVEAAEEAEGSAEAAAATALAEAEAAAEQMRTDIEERAMNVAEDTAFVAEELAKSIEAPTDDPIYSPPPVAAPAQASSRTPREAQAPRINREPRVTAPEGGDAEDAATACANAAGAGDYTNTISSCQSAARLNPRSASVYTYLGQAYYELGQDRDAATALERAIQLDRRNGTAMLTLGALKQGAGDATGAREVYETYLQFNPNSRRASEVRRILEQEL